MNINFFSLNRCEYWLFRLIKPVGWALFSIGLIGFVVFYTLWLVNLKEVLDIKLFEFDNAGYVGSEIAKYMDKQNGFRIIDDMYIYSWGMFVSSLFCVLTRLNTKIWLILRNFNQYYSAAYDYYHDKKKFWISLIFFSLTIIFNALMFVFVWTIFSWLNEKFVNLNDQYKELYNKIYNTADMPVPNATLEIEKYVQYANSITSEIRLKYILEKFSTYCIIGCVGLGGWILTNIIYGFIIIFYEPIEREIQDEEWSYLSQVSKNIGKRKQMPVGNPMSYSEYNRYSTNNHSGKHQNIRDRQYETFRRRLRE